MAGLLLPTAVFRAVDANGAPMNGAALQFYLTGTTTPANVYTANNLSTPLSNPVLANSAGLFPAIFMDPTVTYRMQLWTNPGPSSGSMVADYDPINLAALEATLAQVNAGVATGVYVSPAKLAGWTGIAAALGFTPLNKAGDTATALNLTLGATPATNAAGYLGAPVNEQDANYVFAMTDMGKIVRANSGSGITYTIPPNVSVAFPVGAAILARNVGAGTVTLTRGAGVTQLLAGGGTSKDVALAQWGLCTLFQESANNWIASGTGIS